MLEVFSRTPATSYLTAIILSWSWCNTFTESARRINLDAISCDPYTLQLYQTRGVPSETDPAIWDPQVRDIICQTIHDSGYYNIFLLVGAKEILENRATYPDIFHQIFSPSLASDSTASAYQYSNPFRERVFKVVKLVGQRLDDVVHAFAENVFMCPIRSRFSRIITPIFVSKEYNVSPFSELYMPGRFIFWFTNRPNEYSLALMEEPAMVYQNVDLSFRVEDHYLRMRKHIELVGDERVDPLCKLVSERQDDPNNQHDRLCVAIARSSYFEDTIRYPFREPADCIEAEVSFRTVNKSELEKSYRERVMSCHSTLIELNRDVHFYISRAYRCNNVFVFERDLTDGKMYLENMSTNVKIVDEINSFDFVEY